MHKMDGRAKRNTSLYAVLLIIIVGACGLFLYLSFFSFPSTEAVAKSYLDAVIHKDMGAVLRLGSSDYLCQNNLKNTALKDIDRFGGAIIREVTITVEGSTGNREEIQWARIGFQYQQVGQTEWKHGEVVISTDHDGLGPKYTCGTG